jgi:hypothetical protein
LAGHETVYCLVTIYKSGLRATAPVWNAERGQSRIARMGAGSYPEHSDVYQHGTLGSSCMDTMSCRSGGRPLELSCLAGRRWALRTASLPTRRRLHHTGDGNVLMQPAFEKTFPGAQRGRMQPVRRHGSHSGAVSAFHTSQRTIASRPPLQ